MNLTDFELQTMPHLVFFKPLPAFTAYVQRICPQKKVIDVGAGCGLLAKTLADKGFKVLAIDLFQRDDPYYTVHGMDATGFEFPADCLPIIARPCHSDWIDQTVHNALTTVPVVLYVGLPKNFDRDLDELGLEYKLTFEPEIVGAEGEQIVKIEKHETI